MSAPSARWNSPRRNSTQGIGSLRVAVLGEYFEKGGDVQAHAAVDAIAAALGVTRRVEFPEAATARAAAYLITAIEAGRLHLERLKARAADFDPATRDRLLAGALMPAAWYLQAQKFRAWYRERVREVFRDVDVVLAPATPVSATLIGQQTMTLDGIEMPVRPNLGIFTQPISFIGLPVVAAPVHTRRSAADRRATHRRAVARDGRAAASPACSNKTACALRPPPRSPHETDGHAFDRGRALRVRFHAGHLRPADRRHAARFPRSPAASAKRWATTCRVCAAPSRRTSGCSPPWRALGLAVLHTREGHRPDLSDLAARKKSPRHAARRIGDSGPMGRILIRGERGHDIIPELAPLAGEPVIDKPGKGAFWATDLHAMLQNRGIRQLVVTGVTTEVCVHTTVREANDRGYDCLVPSDCVGSYFPEFHAVGLAMIKAQGGIFGWISHSEKLLAALN